MLLQYAKIKEGKSLFNNFLANIMVWLFRWLAEIDDTNWHHVDNAWIVDQLLNRRKNEEHSIDTKGPHYEDQWWIGALSTVCFIAVFCYVKGEV